MSLNIVDKSTGELIRIAGNADDSKIGNLADLTTTDKSSCVGAINEVKSGLTDYTEVYRVSGGGADTVAQKLAQLYNHLSDKCVIIKNGGLYRLSSKNDGIYRYRATWLDASSYTDAYFTIASTSADCKYEQVVTNISSGAITRRDYSSSTTAGGEYWSVNV